jgi:hypothetical protein
MQSGTSASQSMRSHANPAFRDCQSIESTLLRHQQEIQSLNSGFSPISKMKQRERTGRAGRTDKAPRARLATGTPDAGTLRGASNEASFEAAHARR